MSIKAVIFDVGGVLLRIDNRNGPQKWEKRLGLQEGELGRMIWRSELGSRVTTGQVPEAQLWMHIAITYGLSGEEVLTLRREMIGHEFLDADLVDFLRGLRPRYQTALLSNAWPDTRGILLNKYGLGDAVDIIILSGEEGCAKPNARIYQLATQRLNVQPNEALFVDDAMSNVEGAQAAGMHAIRFIETEQAVADIQHILNE